MHSRKEIKREHAKRNKQRLLEQMQSRRFQEWDRDHDSERYEPEWSSQLPFSTLTWTPETTKHQAVARLRAMVKEQFIHQ
ncbi:hypothetical protein WMY93_018888 [Mugilogobius chulae]|uniref:Uncharacterized protein n=1 Tax=Mugilogobius chulae TaxID=88201 RepID=A0AAW0NPE1_9GOBI